MRVDETSLPPFLWAWFGFVFFSINLSWTLLCIQAHFCGAVMSTVVLGVYMSISTGILVGMAIGIAIRTGAESYVEERCRLLSHVCV
jgi:hypothetical protein